MSPLPDRIAAAPISWGVCEVPGWGYQLPAARVLAEMRELGVKATEFGPDGFLPSEPAARAGLLAAHGLSAVGGFVPAVLHRADHDPLPGVLRALDAFAATGAGILVLAAVTGLDGYDTRPALEAAEWKLLLANLDAITALAAVHGITAALHPHIGTLVEREDEVWRVLGGSIVPLCLDTGHLLAGGSDPVTLAAEAAERVAHVHLKDVDAGSAGRVRDGRTPYAQAVAEGMYRPLGRGDVDVAALVAVLEDHGYQGWYVMEQDAVLTTAPEPGEGPIGDVRASLEYLAALR